MNSPLWAESAKYCSFVGGPASKPWDFPLSRFPAHLGFLLLFRCLAWGVCLGPSCVTWLGGGGPVSPLPYTALLFSSISFFLLGCVFLLPRGVCSCGTFSSPFFHLDDLLLRASIFFFFCGGSFGFMFARFSPDLLRLCRSACLNQFPRHFLLLCWSPFTCFSPLFPSPPLAGEFCGPVAFSGALNTQALPILLSRSRFFSPPQPRPAFRMVGFDLHPSHRIKTLGSLPYELVAQAPPSAFVFP